MLVVAVSASLYSQRKVKELLERFAQENGLSEVEVMAAAKPRGRGRGIYFSDEFRKMHGGIDSQMNKCEVDSYLIDFFVGITMFLTLVLIFFVGARFNLWN